MSPLLSIFALFLFQTPEPPSPKIIPLVNAHAHNDYEHARPLFDALEHGYCSLEADIFLVDGKLLVAHDRNKVTPERTLDALYLKPLWEQVQKNRGRVYPKGPEVTLLVDIKADGDAVYPVLKAALQPYAKMLTTYRDGKIQHRAISVVLSGSRPRALVEADKERLVALDGELPDLETNKPTNLIPLLSEDWLTTIGWWGQKEFPADKKAKLKAIVEKAHRQGRRVRFWAVPQNEKIWEAEREAGVDLLNADDLDRLKTFLLKNSRPVPK